MIFEEDPDLKIALSFFLGSFGFRASCGPGRLRLADTWTNRHGPDRPRTRSYRINYDRRRTNDYGRLENGERKDCRRADLPLCVFHDQLELAPSNRQIAIHFNGGKVTGHGLVHLEMHGLGNPRPRVFHDFSLVWIKRALPA